MSRSGWLAIGSVIAALLSPGVDVRVTALIASSVAISAIASARARPPAPGIPTTAPRALLTLALVAIGSLAIAVRLLAAGPVAVAEPLPEGHGPWTAAVTARSPNREGAQVATVRLERPPASSWLIAATFPRYPEIEPGDLVRLVGSLEPPPDGGYGKYLERIGVAGTVRSRTLEIVGHVAGPGAALERLRRWAGDALSAAIPEPEAGLAAGIVIGLRDRVDRDLAADFTTVGASHVVAISGWNIAIVGATVAALAGRLGRRRRTVVLIPAILVYVVFAGGSPSVVRAAAMAGVVLLARETGRAGRASAALGWAAALLLIADPSLVLDAGFQLSTLATAGILAWADQIERRLAGAVGGRLPAWLAESLGVSLAAQAATLPIVLVTFGRLAIISPVINLAIVPLVAPAMAAALIALLGGGIALTGGPTLLAVLAGLPAWAVLTAICTIVRGGAAIPFASVSVDPPWSLVLAGLLLIGPLLVGLLRNRSVTREIESSARRASAATLRPITGSADATTSHPVTRRQSRFAAVSLAVAVGTLGVAAAHHPTGAATITVLDVGQGDGILIEGGRGGRMLVDGGPDPDRLIVELDRRLPPWDRRIDVVVLSHPHEDHVAGLPLLLERYRVGRVYETGMRGPGPGYAAFASDLAGAGAPAHGILAAGARIGLDDIRLDVLWPDPGRVPREPPDGGRGINDVSIVLLGSVAGRRFLLTGDVEDDVDPLLAERGLPPVDILKVAHHGSATASTPAFLSAVRPAVAVVSSGADNPYGHPARSTIERLTDTGARVLRTDTDGSVSVSIGTDGTIRVATSGGRAVSSVADVARNGPKVAVRPFGDRVAAAVAVAAPRRVANPPVPALAFTCGIPSAR